MKKITYSLHLGLTGSETSGKEIFIEFLKEKGYEYYESSKDGFHEVLLIFDQIPIKMKIFSLEDLNSLLLNYEGIKKLDMIILAMNIYEINSIKEINKEIFENFEKDYAFQGSSVLAGIDVESVNI